MGVAAARHRGDPVVDRKGYSRPGRGPGMVDPAVLVAAGTVLAAAALALADGYSHWTVPAVGPWAVAGAVVHLATRAGVYDDLPSPGTADLLLPGVVLLAAVAWVVVGRIAASRGVAHRERYLAAMGSGLAATLVVALLFQARVPAADLAWVIAVPLAAALVATAGFLAVGFVVADLFTDLRVAGLYTVVTVVFEAVASVAAMEVLSGAGDAVLVDGLREAYATAGVAATWWAIVASQLAVALVVVLACGRLARWRSAAGRAAVLVVSVVALWSGTAVLLAAATLG